MLAFTFFPPRRRAPARARRRSALLVFALAAWWLAPQPSALRGATPPAPAPATARIAAPVVTVRPDRSDWNYRPGDPVIFQVSITSDGHPLPDAAIDYTVGPEMLPPTTRGRTTVPAAGLAIEGGTLNEPGFIRCSVTTEFNGRTYRGVATAGFAPEQIAPTQTEPADFDAFWADGKAALARVPLDARVTLMPEACTESVNVYHVSFRTAGAEGARVYGILCEPALPGKYPAILRVPGAGVRPYTGGKRLAARGAIVLDIGVHGIPVNLPPELYEQLRTGALHGYPALQLDDRERYYYRRVYLGCIRANDFLVSRETWDGSNLVVMGGSQGGQLALVTAALDPRVKAAAANHPAYCDVTGYLHGRAGGWPHLLRDPADGHRTPAKLATSSYYDVVNFARRLTVPVHLAWGYNDETCPPTSLYAAYNVIAAPKELLLSLAMGHAPSDELVRHVDEWVLARAGVSRIATAPSQP